MSVGARVIQVVGHTTPYALTLELWMISEWFGELVFIGFLFSHLYLPWVNGWTQRRRGRGWILGFRTQPVGRH